jgi:hypothetical protein
MTNPSPKKPSKAERLAADLATAREALARAEADLLPKISAEETRVAKLRSAFDLARKAAARAYDALKTVRDARTAVLGLDGAGLEKLRAEVKSFVESRGLPNADVSHLAGVYVRQVLAADVETAKAAKVKQDADKVEDAARGAWNVASSPMGGLAILTRRLFEARERVENLATELDRLPGRREASRDRKRQDAAEEREGRETSAALALMGEFAAGRSAS